MSIPQTTEVPSHSLSSEKQLELMKVLSSPIRFRIYQTLSEPKSVAELAEIFGIQRKLLYYHIHQLEKFDLIEIVDTIDIGHLRKNIYKKKDLPEQKIPHEAPMEIKREACNALATILTDITNEFCQAVTREGNHGGGVYLKSIMIKSEDLVETGEKVAALFVELTEKIKTFEDPDGDIELKTLAAMFKK